MRIFQFLHVLWWLSLPEFDAGERLIIFEMNVKVVLLFAKDEFSNIQHHSERIVSCR